MSESESKSKQENERQYRVIDQMLTMHSSYRDRMERRAFWLNTLLIASSVVLTVFAFISDDLLRTLGIDPAISRFLLGWIAVVVLVCAITEFRVDWRTVAGRHDEAVSRLKSLKAKYRKAHTETGGDDDKKNARLTSEYDKTLGDLPSIPDRWFATLKAEHQFKRMLSERISLCPKAPKWYLSLQLRKEGISEARQLALEDKRDQQGEPHEAS